MKNKKRNLFLAIVGIILIVGIVSAVLFAYKKSTEPIPSLHCNLHEAAVLAQAADFLQLETEKTTLNIFLTPLNRMESDKNGLIV